MSSKRYVPLQKIRFLNLSSINGKKSKKKKKRVRRNNDWRREEEVYCVKTGNQTFPCGACTIKNLIETLF